MRFPAAEWRTFLPQTRTWPLPVGTQADRSRKDPDPDFPPAEAQPVLSCKDPDLLRTWPPLSKEEPDQRLPRFFSFTCFALDPHLGVACALPHNRCKHLG